MSGAYNQTKALPSRPSVVIAAMGFGGVVANPAKLPAPITGPSGERLATSFNKPPAHPVEEPPIPLTPPLQESEALPPDDVGLPSTQVIPHNREAEEAVVGAVLINPEAYSDLAQFLQADDFYIVRHRWIWEAFAHLHEKLIPLDFLTVTEELQSAGQMAEIGGPAYLTALLNQVPTSLHAETYGRMVEANAIRRRMLTIANKIATLAYNERETVPVILAEMAQQVESLSAKHLAMGGAPKTWADLGELSNVKFAWEGWLARGLLAILAGESGIGKSYLALRICGSFLLALPWPDGSPFTGEAGAILWCEAEAAQAVNLSRARAWGYPLELFYTPLADPLADISLDNADHRAAIAAKAALPEVKLIIVDSLSGSSNRKESDTEIKRITEFLARLARDLQKPILLTHHLRKRSVLDGGELTLDRLRGSSAIVQAARVIWGMDIPDPAHKERIRLSQVKNNLRRFPGPMGMAITDAGVTFGDAPAAPKQETQQERAADMLIAMLTPGSRRVREIQSVMQQAGISWKTVALAKSHLKIPSVKKQDGWYWSLSA